MGSVLDRDLTANLLCIEHAHCAEIGVRSVLVAAVEAVDACVGNGCDLPVLEYILATGDRVTSRAAPALPRIWCDTERDPGCFLRTIADVRRTGLGWLPIFPYLSVSDPGPFFKACRRYAGGLPQRIGSRLRRL